MYLTGVARGVTRVSSRGQVVILVETGPPGERVIIPHGRSRDEIRERLARAYSWFERTGRDLVEELHESRRRARKRERDDRRP